MANLVSEENRVAERNIRLTFQQNIATMKAMSKALEATRSEMQSDDIAEVERDIAHLRRVSDYCARALSSLPETESAKKTALKEHCALIHDLISDRP